ncbi:ATP-dependent DNA helicase [Oleiharenicola sp. Vm1]|uniref:ATP-dependent DNA helicase n=1 Tax=Oleiharenicola sp. Vm1 TaxID=3398393 RepID=UPI0039F531FF
MQFSLATQTASLSVGEFSDFALGPREGGGGSAGVWRAQLGQHWHNELRAQTEREHTVDGSLRPDVAFEIPIEGRLVHRGWTLALAGRIDQLVGSTLREIKTVTRPLPADEPVLRADYSPYFLQLATYVVLRRLQGAREVRAELVFVEAGSGLAQTLALTAFDEALVTHQLDAVVEFLELQRRAAARRHRLAFQSPFPSLRPGQETIHADLAAAFGRAPVVLLEAPTGYGKTGCALEFALGELRSARYDRLVWLTGKSTGQLQVVETLRRMTAAPGDLAFWQVRNKGEHCINVEFHCVRDSCGFLAGAEERWPASGLARFYRDPAQARDLDTLRAAGREAHLCPYEITRTALAFNDVWIGDYNYVFAPDNRGLFFDQPGFDPARTLLIVDEAHNLPSRVAAAYSHTAHDGDVRALLAELDHQRAPTPLVLAVETWARTLASVPPCEVLDGALEADARDALDRLAELVTTLPLDYAALGPHHSETLWQFAKLHDFLHDPRLRRLLWSRRAGELEFTCVDATEAIGESLAAFGGTLLMSATLAPFDSFAASCGVTNHATLRAPAPWRHGAYDVAVDLRVSTTLRGRAASYGTTAETIERLHAASGRAVAVFFPSYAYAESVLRALDQIGSPLRASLQPKLPDLAAQAAWVEETLALADALFLVLGSSFAESIDLLGGRVSHAMVVGPALPEVNAVQRARLDAFSALGRDAAFRRVYQIPGLQKVNQALGRLVRGPGHHAKVLLHCQRFAETSYASLLDPECQHYREVFTAADLAAWLDA